MKMKKNIIKLSLVGLILALASCAAKQQAYEYNWDGSLIPVQSRST